MEIRQLLKTAWLKDPRLTWLLSALRELPHEKFLLICSQKAVILEIQEWLSLAKDIDVAVFHEDMNVVERDRQAAYFSQREGAQVLLCSEIGSEGRNFQFANRLILFDLPLNPALLEQRIGRLDRIGQQRDVEIYIPYVEKSPQDFLFKWYHHGLDAFENHLIDGDYIYEHLKEQIFFVFDAVDNPEIMEPFIAESRRFAEELKATIEQGRDRLLEIHSFNRSKADILIEAIESLEDGIELKDFMDRIFDVFNISVEDQDHLRTQIVKPTPQMTLEHFPELPEEGSEITYDREVAVTREELTFLSFDHPMVVGAIDLYLAADRGSTSFALWKNAPEPGILLQTLFVLEGQGADVLRFGRYIPPTPILLAVDQNRRLRPDLLETLETITLDYGPLGKLRQQRQAFTDIVSGLLEIAHKEADSQAQDLLDKAENFAMTSHKEEYGRLKALMAINPGIREEELHFIEARLGSILDHLEQSRIRLDGVRLIMMVPN